MFSESMVQKGDQLPYNSRDVSGRKNSGTWRARSTAIYCFDKPARVKRAIHPGGNELLLDDGSAVVESSAVADRDVISHDIWGFSARARVTSLVDGELDFR